MRLKLFTIGKTKEAWLIAAIEEYTTRLKSVLTIEWIVVKDLKHLESYLAKEKSYICLDRGGNSFSSEEFAEWVFKEWERGGARFSMVIGGAEGLSQKILTGASQRLSLSPMTFTHQMTRLILLEQIFRAFEIKKGSAYHK